MGQVLVYGSYFPNRAKEIVLVGKASTYIDIAKTHCEAFGVEVIDFHEM